MLGGCVGRNVAILIFLHTSDTKTLASFLGSSAPECKIELVNTGYFSHVRTLKGRKAVERP